jgi:hypothetical protein
MSKPELGFQGYTGRLGQWTFYRRNGRLVASRVPSTRPEATDAQLGVQRQFRLAAAYARTVTEDPLLRPRYETLATARKTSVHQVAMADALRLPVVDSIDLEGFKGMVGNPIRVVAFDDVDVMEVSIEIRAADGTVLEQGAATLDGGKWVYVTTVAYPAGTPITITATAVDRPGGRGSKLATWS